MNSWGAGKSRRRAGLMRNSAVQPRLPASAGSVAVDGTALGFRGAVHGLDAPQRVASDAKNSDTSPSKAAAIWVRGYVVRGQKLQVLLTDGRVLSEGDENLTRLDRCFAVVDGNRVYMEQAKDRVSSDRPEVKNVQLVENLSVVKPVAPVLDYSGGSWRTDADGVSRLRHPDSLDTVTQTSTNDSLLQNQTREAALAAAHNNLLEKLKAH